MMVMVVGMLVMMLALVSDVHNGGDGGDVFCIVLGELAAGW